MKRLRWHSADGQTFTAVVTIPVWRADDEAKRWVLTGETTMRDLVIWWDVVERKAKSGWRDDTFRFDEPSLREAKRTGRWLAVNAQGAPCPKLTWMPEPDRVPGFEGEVVFANGRAPT